MGTLTITKSYSTGSALLESHIDNFRTGLLTLFNTDKLASGNFGTTALGSAKFSQTKLTVLDSTTIDFGTDSDGTIGVNSSKDLVFNTVTASCTMTFKSVSKTIVFKTTQVDLPGECILGAGGSGYGIMHLISRYRKPVLEYSGSSSVTLENNTGTANQTLISFPKYLIAVTEALSGSEKYRKLVLSNTANGYVSTHTGTAMSGIRVGLTLTANTWYSVYAARVRYGTNAGNNFIMVADSILPTQTNEATLDDRYGSGQWVYIGLIRYGYGSAGSTSSIINFKQTNKGWCYFTNNDTGATTGGLALAQSTADANDTPLYTVADSMSGASLPCDAIPVAQFNVARSSTSDWTIRDASDVVTWRGGWANTGLSPGHIHGHSVIMNVQIGMDFTQTRIDTGAVDKRVVLTGYCDKFINVRRHGHGI